MSKNYLSRNDELRRGDYLLSNNGQWKAVFQVSNFKYFNLTSMHDKSGLIFIKVKWKSNDMEMQIMIKETKKRVKISKFSVCRMMVTLSSMAGNLCGAQTLPVQTLFACACSLTATWSCTTRKASQKFLTKMNVTVLFYLSPVTNSCGIISQSRERSQDTRVNVTGIKLYYITSSANIWVSEIFLIYNAAV